MTTEARRNRSASPGPARHRPPRPLPDFLARPRLTERFHAFIGHGLTVVQAPAGYGKTVAITSFVAGLDYDVRWLCLDGSATSPEVFANQVVTAILGDDSWEPPAAARPEDLRAYVNAALDRREQTALAPLLLVVDNAHEISDAYQSCDLLAWIIETAPFGTEIIISSREPVPLDAIDERVSGGQCLFVGARDLVFTRGEVEALCARADCAFTPDEILEATDGWPIAVMGVLAGAVSLKGIQDAIAGGAWERYLCKEIWQTIPAAFADSLALVSPPPVVEDWLGETMLGGERWRQLRHWITERDFLCERLSDGGVRFNPQFLACLRERLNELGDSVAEAAVSTAATALERRGLVAEAIETALDRPAVLGGLLLRHHQEMFHQGAFKLLWRGYSRLPDDILQGDEILEASRIRVMAHAGFPERALELSDEFLSRRGASSTARYHVLLGRIRAFRLLSRVADLTNLFTQAKEAVENADQALVAEFTWQEAEAVLAVDADFSRVERLLLQVLNLAEASNHRTLGLLAASTYGHLLVMRGEGPEGVNQLLRAAQGWRATPGSANLGWVLNNLGMAYVLVGDFASALSVLREAQEEAARCQNRRTEAFAIASVGDAELALGHFEAARKQFEQAIRICAEEVLDESLATLSVAGLAQAMLGLGKVDDADFLARRALDAAGLMSNPFELGQCALLLAAIELAAGNNRKAVASAQRAVELFSSIDARASLRQARYRLAQCQFKAGKRDAALATLRKLSEELTESWMAGGLVPFVRENPVFAQWAASRPDASSVLRIAVMRLQDEPEASEAGEDEAAEALPAVRALSLGAVRVWCDGREVSDDDWDSARARELFYLFLSKPRGVRKEEAVECLYPDLPPARCNSAFHTNIYRVRRALYRDSIIRQDGVYRLNPGGAFDWDAGTFEEVLDRAASLPSGSEERAQLCESALKLYGGPFAETFESEWANSLRRRLESRARESLATLAGYYAGRGRFEMALSVLERLLEMDPYDEDAAYRLAESHARNGQPGTAIQFLDSYTARVQNDLGVQPNVRLSELREAIAAGRAS